MMDGLMAGVGIGVVGLLLLWLIVLPWMIRADARWLARQYGVRMRDDRTYTELLRFAPWRGEVRSGGEE